MNDNERNYDRQRNLSWIWLINVIKYCLIRLYKGIKHFCRKYVIQLYRKYFIAQIRNIYRRKKKRKLKNDHFSIISNNCCGGIMYHDLGKRFDSPTINLYLLPKDYLLFVENIQESLSKDVIEYRNNDLSFPVGIIELDCGESIMVYFMHYQTFDEARAKWNERKKRINWDNLFVFFEMGMETSDEYLLRFMLLPYKNKLAVINKKQTGDNTVYLDIYNDEYYSGKIIDHKHGVYFYKRYLDDIDYIKWINYQ